MIWFLAGFLESGGAQSQGEITTEGRISWVKVFVKPKQAWVLVNGYFAMSVLEEAGWLERAHWVHTAGIDSLRKQST